jgi:hypothetical protein
MLRNAVAWPVKTYLGPMQKTPLGALPVHGFELPTPMDQSEN